MELTMGWIKGDDSRFLMNATSVASSAQIIDLAKLQVSGQIKPPRRL